MIPMHPRAEWTRYVLLSSYDVQVINAALGTSYQSLGDVYRAQREAYDKLDAAERRLDVTITTRALQGLPRR